VDWQRISTMAMWSQDDDEVPSGGGRRRIGCALMMAVLVSALSAMRSRMPSRSPI